MNIPFNKLEFKFLTESADVSSFKCEDKDLEDFIKEDALKNQLARISVTRLGYFEEILVGYFTLVTDSFEVKAVQDPDGEKDYPYRKYPAIKIARLATHQNFQRRRIGENMLLKIFFVVLKLSDYVGCRIITVDAKTKSVGFYEKYGFKQVKASQGDTIPFYIDYHRALQAALESDKEKENIFKFLKK